MPITYKDSSRPSTSRIKYQDSQSPRSQQDNSIYAKGGEWDLRNKFGRFGTGPKILGLPTKEMALTSGIPPAMIYEMITKEPAEDILPAAGQMLGGFIKTANPLAGFVAPVAGAVAGQAGRQGVKAIRGFNPDLSMIPKEAGMTAGVELVSKGLPRIPFLGFRKQIGGKAREEAGKKIGQISSQVEKKAPFIRFSKNDIIQRIDDQLEASKFEIGPHRTALKNIKKMLQETKQPLSFTEMRQLEQTIGSQAFSASEATAPSIFRAAKPKAPAAKAGLKSERARVSAKVDEAAKLAGYPEFEKESLRYSKLMKKFPEKDLQRGGWVRNAATLALAGGGTAYPMFGEKEDMNPALGAALLMASLSPRAKTMIYRKVFDNPYARTAGRALTLGASEMARRGLENAEG